MAFGVSLFVHAPASGRLPAHNNPARPRIHLINPLWDAAGGSEWRTLSLFDALKPHCDVQLWSQFKPDPALSERFPIRSIAPRRLQFPKSGTFVFVGVYFPIGRWIYLTRPQRVILVYNTFRPDEFLRTLRRLSIPTFPKVEIVYASDELKASVGEPGIVETSPIDLTRFTPSRRTPTAAGRRPVLGRLSRDVPAKHHADDPALYLRLAQDGWSVRIMGGTCLGPQLDGAPHIALLPAGAQDAAAFLQGLDCFFYRTPEDSKETFGRVVAEAMACELPVVCHKLGGYAEMIEHGRNGFLFDTNHEALAILQGLRDDPGLRERAGKAARETVQALYAPAVQQAIFDFYVRGSVHV